MLETKQLISILYKQIIKTIKYPLRCCITYYHYNDKKVKSLILLFGFRILKVLATKTKKSTPPALIIVQYIKNNVLLHFRDVYQKITQNLVFAPILYVLSRYVWFFYPFFIHFLSIFRMFYGYFVRVAYNQSSTQHDPFDLWQVFTILSL